MRYRYGRRNRFYEASNLTGTKGGWMEDEDDITMAEADEIAEEEEIEYVIKNGLCIYGDFPVYGGPTDETYWCVDPTDSSTLLEVNEVGELSKFDISSIGDIQLLKLIMLHEQGVIIEQFASALFCFEKNGKNFVIESDGKVTEIECVIIWRNFFTTYVAFSKTKGYYRPVAQGEFEWFQEPPSTRVYAGNAEWETVIMSYENMLHYKEPKFVNGVKVFFSCFKE